MACDYNILVLGEQANAILAIWYCSMQSFSLKSVAQELSKSSVAYDSDWIWYHNRGLLYKM